MRKHMFIVKFDHCGHRTLDTYASCIWPLHASGNDRGTAKAYLAMIDGEKNLPKDVQDFMDASKWMWLRARYAGGNAEGPFLINDEGECINGLEEMEEFINDLPYAELQKYRYRHTTKGDHR